MRRLERPEHRRRRGRIRRRDHRAEGDRGRPLEARHHRPRHHGNRGRRQPDADDDQAGDRAPVFPQVAGRGVVGGVEQHRRDEERKGEVRLDGEDRSPGDERQDRPAEGKERRVGRSDATRESGQENRREQERDQNLECMHGDSVDLDRAAQSQVVTGRQPVSPNRGP